MEDHRRRQASFSELLLRHLVIGAFQATDGAGCALQSARHRCSSTGAAMYGVFKRLSIGSSSAGRTADGEQSLLRGCSLLNERRPATKNRERTEGGAPLLA